MSVAERDFSTFELGDDVYELAGGVMVEIAERLDMPLGREPNSDDLYKLVGKLGKNKVLRDNQEVTAINTATAAHLLEVSGVQKPLNRSLWTPDIQLSDLGPGGASSGLVVVTGGVANWQDRTAELVAEGVHEGTLPESVRVVTGNRVMGKLKSESENPNVKAFWEKESRPPTETEYAEEFVLPILDKAGARPVLTSYDTDSGEEIADNFTRNIKVKARDREEKGYEKLFQPGNPVVFARVANAGVQLAVQFRQALRRNVDPDFDSSEGMPDVFIRTDTFPIATTDEQIGDPVNYQSPYSGLRQAVLTAKLLNEAAQA